MLVADLTKAHADLLESCIQSILRWQKDHATERLILFFQADQRTSIETRVGSVEQREISVTVSDTLLRDIIFAEYVKPFVLSGTASELMDIVSFRREVVRAQTLSIPPERVRFFYWAGFFQQMPFRMESRPAGNFSHVVTAEMIESLVGVVREQKEPILQAQLRALLSRKRPDLFSRYGNEGVRVGTLIDEASAKGLIKIDKSHAGAARVSLSVPPSTPAQATTTAQIVANKEKVRVDRPQEFFDLLEVNDFGPYTAIRPKLYDFIADYAKEKKYSPLVLLRKAVFALHARDNLKGIYLENVALFLAKLFTRRPVLISETGEVLSPGSLTDIDSKVGGFNSAEGEWRDDLDSAILEMLIEKDGRVRNSEFSELSMALFNERADDGQARVGRLIAKLNRAKRISMDANGYFRVVAQK